MSITRIAVPAQTLEGLTSKRSEHFGHSKFFTLIDIAGETITQVQQIENIVHANCMMPVKLLQDFKVNALIVSGIGSMPLKGFIKAGIDVFYAPKHPYRDVISLIKGMTKSEFTLMDPEKACKGHGSCRVKPFDN